MSGAPVPIDAARLVTAAVRLPFALFWGPGCVFRRTVHSFLWGHSFPWGAPPAYRPRPTPMQVYKIACEPPCYGGCGCACRHG